MFDKYFIKKFSVNFLYIICACMPLYISILLNVDTNQIILTKIVVCINVIWAIVYTKFEILNDEIQTVLSQIKSKL